MTSLHSTMNKKIAFSLALGSLLVSSIALAQTVSPTPSGSTRMGDKEMHKMTVNVDGACMATAVDKRDSAIEVVVDTYASTVKMALETRKTALKAAWGMSDVKARRQAINEAWNAYKKSVKSARRVFKTSRNAAWSQFRTDAKVCHGSSSEDNGGAGSDAQL